MEAVFFLNFFRRQLLVFAENSGKAGCEMGEPGVVGNKKVTELLEDTAPRGRFTGNGSPNSIGITTAYVAGSPASQWQGLDGEGEKVNLVACGCDGSWRKLPAVSSALGTQSWMSTLCF